MFHRDRTKNFRPDNWNNFTSRARSRPYVFDIGWEVPLLGRGQVQNLGGLNKYGLSKESTNSAIISSMSDR